MPDDTRKLFDVAHPGQTPANAASRPVIVGNKPVMQDPMMLQRTDAPATLTPHGNGLLPLHDDVKPEESTDQKPANMSVISGAPAEDDQQFTQLIDQGSYFVHIKGAKSKKIAARFFLLLGALIAMAAFGYYSVTFLKK